MKVKILGVQGYNYMGKDGLQKMGRSLYVTTPTPISKDDGHGNFMFGDFGEFISLKDYPISTDELLDLVQCIVNLNYDRIPGQKFEHLSEILALESIK